MSSPSRRPSFVSPVDERTGLIRWVFDLPVLPGEPSVFNCAVKMADVARYLKLPCYDNNGGGGLTREAARGAAIGEGLERYCAAVYDPGDLVFGAAGELRRRHEVTSPEDYALFHPDQEVEFSRFDEETPLGWAWGHSLLKDAPTLVPAGLVYMPYALDFRGRGERAIAPAVSTGLACARSHDEALLKGVYEAVERDAFMITWLNRLAMPRVEIESNAALGALYRDRLAREGLRYTLIDMTADVPIPSFVCLLADERRTPPMICAGGAAGLDPTRAASKALLEAVQTLEWAKFLGEGKTFDFAPGHGDVRTFEDHVTLYGYGDMRAAVEFLTEAPVRSDPHRWRNRSSGDPASDLARVRSILAEMKVEVVALDLTTPDVAEAGYRVTKALAPSLQPLYADYRHRFLGGSRLYQVPRRLGLAAADTTIGGLNPHPHPYP